jgi:hypothetical protein
MKTNVRFWPLADIRFCTARVRFEGQSGHRECNAKGQSGHAQRKKIEAIFVL